jgi:hypothetical protein
VDHETARTIAAAQQADGSIPWEPGRHVDPWNHVEASMGMAVAGLRDEAEAAYTWLARTQNPDGSWYAAYRDGHATDRSRDTSFTAYIAVGVRHHWLLTGDTRFLTRMWPVVSRALDFVVGLQQPDGRIPWRLNRYGIATDEVMLAGCSSIHHALLCTAHLATDLDQPPTRWHTAADLLRQAITNSPDTFTTKPHAMDWYYPVLGGVLTPTTASTRITEGWDRFVAPGLGVRCVHDQPWVTGGETAELALTLATRGRHDTARELLGDIARLRHTDGSYWTGYQYANQVLWPSERATWTAGAILLAHAAIADEPATRQTFTTSPHADDPATASPPDTLWSRPTGDRATPSRTAGGRGEI